MTLERAAAGIGALPACLMLAAAVAPFEVALPGSFFGLTLTTAEFAVLVVLSCALITWWRDPHSISAWTPISAPLMAWLISAAVAANATPEFRADALRVTARWCVAVALFVLTANVAASARDARRIIAAVVASAAVVGVIAVVELSQWPAVLDALKAFRPGFHVVGGQLRATSTLVYPTVASMFLEVAFALGLAWVGTSAWALAALVPIAAGVVATFTRAGLITMALSLVVVGAVWYSRSGRWSRVHTRLSMLALIIAALVLASRSPQMLVARMSAEGSQEWYGASYDVPARLTLSPDSFTDVPVTLTNEGRLIWQSSTAPPFALSYHWLSARTEELVIFDGLRTPFVDPIPPGRSVSMSARLRAPAYPGDYILIWDVVQEHRTWLSLEGVFPGRTLVSVEGAPAGPPLVGRGRMPGSNLRMPRAVLWRTAAAIAAEHPLLGIGPDNFRHVYGRHLGLAAWDSRVHANNTYLEVLTGMGVAGAGLLGWLLVRSTRALPAILAGGDEDRLATIAASLAACVAIGAHGLVDSFLTFTPTYIAFAIAAGILFARRTGVRACA